MWQGSRRRKEDDDEERGNEMNKTEENPGILIPGT